MLKTQFTGTELIDPLKNICIRDFWAWAYSDILDNRNRAIFGEFIVGCALGIVEDVRAEWDAVDLHVGDHTIEVKTSAYVQTWVQGAPSRIVFDIRKKYPWDASSNEYGKLKVRSADVYVFCLLTEQDRESVNPLRLEQWRFYVVPTRILDDKYPDAKSLSLSTVETLASSVTYKELRASVEAVLTNVSTNK